MGERMSSGSLVKKIQSLPAERTREVEDFVDFLIARDSDEGLTREVQWASQDVLHDVWDNELDAVYDES